MYEAIRGCNFIAYISDTDFKEAGLFVMPQRLFPDADAGGTLGRIFVASVDRRSQQTEPYWCLNEFVKAVARCSPPFARASRVPRRP